MSNLNIQDVLSDKKFTNKEKILYAISQFPDGITTSGLNEYLLKNGFDAKNVLKNLTQHLNSYKGLIVKIDSKDWKLNKNGENFIKENSEFSLGTDEKVEIKKLKALLKNIKDPQILTFLTEAVKCSEENLFRAAIVLSWVGAVSILHDYTFKNRLKDYNIAGRSRFIKDWKDAKVVTDLSNIKETNFLQLILDIGIIDKNVKPELDACLKRRNSCGHPNSLKVGTHTVNSHIEILILNVFEKFI